MKNILKSVLVLIILVSSVSVFAQQDPVYTQYLNNLNLINPAYSGSHGFFSGTANFRSQWVGEPGAPETTSLSTHGPVGKKVGLGLSIVSDEVYVLQETHLFADFSYTINISGNALLAFGLKAGGTFLNIDLNELGITDDPLFSENVSTFNPNIGLGAYFYTNKLYVGLSTVNLLSSDYYERNNNVVTSASKEVVIYLTAGYVFNLGDTFQLKPSFLSRAINGSPLSTDISASILWNNRIEIGVSHRIDTSTSGIFQVRLNDYFKVGYSYDAFSNSIGNYNDGSHEVNLVFDIGRAKSDKTITSPFNW